MLYVFLWKQYLLGYGKSLLNYSFKNVSFSNNFFGSFSLNFQFLIAICLILCWQNWVSVLKLFNLHLYFLLFPFYSLETGLCCDLHQNGHKFLYQTRWIWCLSLRYSTSLSILFIDHESRNTSAFGHYHFFLDHYL